MLNRNSFLMPPSTSQTLCRSRLWPAKAVRWKSSRCWTIYISCSTTLWPSSTSIRFAAAIIETKLTVAYDNITLWHFGEVSAKLSAINRHIIAVNMYKSTSCFVVVISKYLYKHNIDEQHCVWLSTYADISFTVCLCVFVCLYGYRFLRRW